MATAYSLADYGKMIRCEPRMGAFAEALRQSVTPGCRVIDIGAGPGLFALLAAQFGAGEVIAIEPDSSIEIARLSAADNGLRDKIKFVRDLSVNYRPESRADVIISDIRGVLPLFEHHIDTVRDARSRLLKPGGVVIPGVDHIYAALVESPGTYRTVSEPWIKNAYGMDLTAAFPYAINNWLKIYQPKEALLGDAQRFLTLDYQTVDATDHKASLRLTVGRPGTLHGILMWFETELTPTVGYSNAPGQPELVYGQAFFPIEQPLAVREGLAFDVELAARYINGEYVWTWSLSGTDADGRAYKFRQSTFKGEIFTPEILAPRAAGYRPSRKLALEIDMTCVGMFDGSLTLLDIAERLIQLFPDRFNGKSHAFDHVAGLSARYSA